MALISCNLAALDPHNLELGLQSQKATEIVQVQNKLNSRQREVLAFNSIILAMLGKEVLFTNERIKFRTW
jgi:Tfp pilus assembly protein FimV